jgi:hypothetical protein
MDVGAWLRGLGLGQYEGTFRESEIEADVLPELTEADLETVLYLDGPAFPQSIGRPREQGGHFRYWHQTDMPPWSPYVRCLGQNGKHVPGEYFRV